MQIDTQACIFQIFPKDLIGENLSRTTFYDRRATKCRTSIACLIETERMDFKWQ